MDWAILPLRRYAELAGRSRRKEFWLFHLALFALQLAAGLIDGALGMGALVLDLWGPLTFLSLLVFLTPSLSVSVRRLHDTGRSGWWMLLLLTVLGGLVLIYFWAQDGDPRSNAHGASPKERTHEASKPL